MVCMLIFVKMPGIYAEMVLVKDSYTKKMVS
jgi:hypothetical protein